MVPISDTARQLAADRWTAVPRAQTKVHAHVDRDAPAAISAGDIKLPDSVVVKRVYEYAKSELPEKTFNHSMSDYYYGIYFCATHGDLLRNRKQRVLIRGGAAMVKSHLLP